MNPMADESRILNLLQRIDRALLAEIDVIREGRFQELKAVQVETMEALQSLDGVRAALRQPGLDTTRIQSSMRAISERANHARDLVGAALNGARDAKNRIQGLISAEGQIGAYDRAGAPVVLSTIGSPYNKTM